MTTQTKSVNIAPDSDVQFQQHTANARILAEGLASGSSLETASDVRRLITSLNIVVECCFGVVNDPVDGKPITVINPIAVINLSAFISTLASGVAARLQNRQVEAMVCDHSSTVVVRMTQCQQCGSMVD